MTIPTVETVESVIDRLRNGKTCGGKPWWARFSFADEHHVLGAIFSHDPMAIEMKRDMMPDAGDEIVLAKIRDPLRFEVLATDSAATRWRVVKTSDGLKIEKTSTLIVDTGGSDWQPSADAAVDHFVSREYARDLEDAKRAVAFGEDDLRSARLRIHYAREKVRELESERATTLDGLRAAAKYA